MQRKKISQILINLVHLIAYLKKILQKIVKNVVENN